MNGVQNVQNKKFSYSGLLSDLITNEFLSICALSCECVVAEAIAHVDLSRGEYDSALKARSKPSLSRDDLLMFQSIAIIDTANYSEYIALRKDRKE
jgi:hypothetical protein